MTEKSGATLSRLMRHLLAVVAVAFGASALWAQGSTGKVEGSVADPNGQPVAGAQVTIVGTAFNAQTDQHGYWFINNVPAGVYEMQAQYIGFTPARVTGVRVLAGQTITVNFALSNAQVLGDITITAAQNPIVPRDQVASKTIVTGSLIEDLGVDNVRQVLAVQPGVVESGRGTEPSIRGGRPGEAAVYVDGALVRSVQTGGSSINLGTNALEEASVTTGAIGSEFGDAQSGVVSFVTRGGGPRWGGSLSYESDEPFGNAMSVGLNRVEANIGGPLMGNLTLNISTTLQGQQSGRYGAGFDSVPSYVLGGIDTTVTEQTATGTRQVEIPRFIQFGGQCDAASNYGFACQGDRAPYNWTTGVTGQAKLQYSFGSGSRVSLTYLHDMNQTRNWNTGYAYQRTSGAWNNSNYYILNWTQQVSRSSDRSLAIDANLSYQMDASINGPLARDYEVSTRSPFGGFSLGQMNFLLDFNKFTDAPGADVTSLNTQADWDRLVLNLRSNQNTRVPYLNRDDLRNSSPYRMNPYAQQTGYNNSGLDTRLTLFQERRLQGRFGIDWQANRFNRFKIGADARHSHVNYYTDGSMVSQIFMNAYTEDPVTYGAYLSDRLDLGDVVVELGMRYDYFKTGALYPTTPGRIFSDPSYDPSNPTANLTEAASHHEWSPTIRVSFPVTENTGFRLSYAQQVQSPNFSTILTGINSDLSFTNTNDVFGRDVGYGKSIQFEFGLRHAFSQDFLLDVAAYNKDNVANYSFRIQPFFDPATNREVNINVVTNADFGNTRGVDLQLTRRLGDIFNGTLSYTFEVAKNTGSDPNSYLRTTGRQISAVTGERVDPPQAILPTDDSRRHNFVGAMSFTFPADFGQGTWYGAILHNGGAFLRYSLASGLPYTRLTNAGNGQTAPFLAFGLAAQQAEPINSSTMPWIKNIDLRLTRGFAIGGLDLTAYADIRNLLNFRNITSLFVETSDVVNAKFRDLSISPEIARLENDAGSRLTQISVGGQMINAVNLPSDCNDWSKGPTDCVLLKRAEARFGNGDGVYDAHEYTAAFTASYNLFNGPYTFYSAPRNARLGVELRF